MVEKVLAAIGLVACLSLLLWTLLGPKRRETLRSTARRGLHWRSHRRAARDEAAKAIERARRPIVDRQGNVYRPKSFSDRPHKDRRDH